MLVKNVGHILLFRCQIHHILHRISHLLMVLSFMLIMFVPSIKDKYQKQEPSLRTKIYDTTNSPNNFTIPYTQVSPGVHVSVVEGLLSYESLIITYPYHQSTKNKTDQQKIIQDVYYSLQVDRNLAKNIVFICYQTNVQFNNFLTTFNTKSHSLQYLNSSLLQKIGVIRSGLNVQFGNRGSKLFYKLYGNEGLYGDLDYYLSIKQLLESLTINWLPCEIIYRNPIYNMMRKNFKTGQLFVKEILCQFHQILLQQEQHESAHSKMLSWGIQSATIKTYGSSSEEEIDKVKLSKLVLSFVKQFSLFEDHLHSASTLYYPFNQYYSVNVKGMILPGLVFLVCTIAYLVDLYCHSPFSFNTEQKEQQQQQKEPYINIPILLSIFVSSWQYYCLGTVQYSFWLGIILRPIVFRYDPINHLQRKYYKIILCAFNSVMIYHLVFYLTPLSYICMVCVCFIAFLPPKLALTMSWSLTLLVLFYAQVSVVSIFSLSNAILIIFYPLSIWATMI